MGWKRGGNEVCSDGRVEQEMNIYEMRYSIRVGVGRVQGVSGLLRLNHVRIY